MRILVVAATALEIGPFLGNDNGVDHLITGVGAAACVYQLQKKLQLQPYDLIIQAGIAGSFTNELALGETVLVQKEVFADLGIFEKGSFTTLFDLGLADRDAYPYQQGWLVNNHPLLSKYHLPGVAAASVNSLSDSPATSALFLDKFKVDIESMEGAAFHYTCLQEKVPFLQLRSISNRVGERDKENWTMKDAITNLNKELQALITHCSI